jgi:hypothetical protein
MNSTTCNNIPGIYKISSINSKIDSTYHNIYSIAIINATIRLIVLLSSSARLIYMPICHTYMNS